MRAFIGEPGAGHRETLASASQAAAAGGVTTIICQPDTTPVIDALTLAHMGLEEEDASLSAFQLQSGLGWDPRRINSAMMMIHALLPGASISKAANPSYLITGIYIDARARLGLRRFVDSARQAGVGG